MQHDVEDVCMGGGGGGGGGKELSRWSVFLTFFISFFGRILSSLTPYYGFYWGPSKLRRSFSSLSRLQQLQALHVSVVNRRG